MQKDITYDNIACSIIAIIQDDIQKDTGDNIVNYTENMTVANLIDYLINKGNVLRLCDDGLILNPKAKDINSLTTVSNDGGKTYQTCLKGKNITLEDLDFSVGTYNCLKRAGLNYKHDIEQLTESDILNIRNITKSRLYEIKEKVCLK